MTQTLAGDFDYDTHGQGYARRRRPDPRIGALIHAALGDARTVLNVGAGAGSYEPDDRYVLAVEPSAAMRAPRPPGAAPAVEATAERLPFDDDSFDAAMATVTVHQWRDPGRGLAELRRVAHGPVVVLTFDGDELERLWLAAYVPELIAAERRRYPPIAAIAAAIGRTEVIEVPIPIDCVDGFTEAFYARPEAFLDERVRAAQSAWGFVPPEATRRAVELLRADLASGAWEQRYGWFRDQRAELLAAGCDRVFGLSAQSTGYQRELVHRLRLPYPLLPDPRMRLAAALGLPTFGAGDMVLYRRLTLVIRDDVIEHVFHPIAAPAMHALEVLQWLTKHRRN